MAILDCIKAIQDLTGAISGIKSAPDYPGSGVFPMVHARLGTGTITPGDPAGQRLELHNLVVELHVAEGGGLADAYYTINALHPLMVAALTADITFGNTIQTYEDLLYSVQRSEWDSIPTVAVYYTLTNAKITV